MQELDSPPFGVDRGQDRQLQPPADTPMALFLPVGYL